MTKEYGEFTKEVKDATSNESKQQLEQRMNEAVKELQELYEANGEQLSEQLKEKIKAAIAAGQSGEGGSGASESESEGEGEAEASQSTPSTKPQAMSLLPWLEYVRDYLKKGDGPRDKVSLATYKNAAKMLAAGIPEKAIKHAFALTWPASVRDELGVEDYNVFDFGEAKEGQHKAVPYVEALVNAGIPAMLVGPTQSGKGYLSQCIAENRGLENYGSVPLSSGTSISWLFGRNMPNEFVGTDLLTCYEHGGVFLFDEIDAADSNLLLAFNDALSRDELSNPVINVRIKKDGEFIPLAAANTFGLGADADYTGRERLDMATLERWRMGRVVVDYDYDLAERIFRAEAGDSYTD